MRSGDYYRGEVASHRGMDWGAAVRVAVDLLGKGASRFLAGAGGGVMRTAERWISKAEGRASQQSTPKPMAQVKIVEAVQRLMVADKIRQSPVAHAGTVEVAYPGTGADEGDRHINDVELDPEDLEAIAAAVERGDMDEAGALTDAAVLDAYGVPEGALEIEDYPDGFYLSD